MEKTEKDVQKTEKDEEKTERRHIRLKGDTNDEDRYCPI